MALARCGESGGATTAINQWVSQATQAAIPMLLQPGDVDASMRVVLVNAVYFKGAWATGFDPNLTRPASFTLSDGTQVSVPTMNGTINFASGYRAGDMLSVYEVPYKGGSFAMDFLVPQGSLSDLEASLTPASLGAALASLQGAFAQPLALPKFSFGNRLDLKPLLAGLGMPDVFEKSAADLWGLMARGISTSTSPSSRRSSRSTSRGRWPRPQPRPAWSRRPSRKA